MPCDESLNSEPFGALAPTARQNWARAHAAKLKPGFFGKQMGSLYRRIAGARSGRPFDVELFDGARARLHPYDNSCERRVYCTPQFWDAAERDYLATLIRKHPLSEPFHFVDIGANVGLYLLFAAMVARSVGRRLAAVAVEPEPTVRNRLVFNLQASNLEDVIVLPWAATAMQGPAPMSASSTNRGENRLAGGGVNSASDFIAEGRTLIQIFDAGGTETPDFMKIDIEGQEAQALGALFDQAPPTRWPRTILLETIHEKGDESASGLCQRAGYRPTLKTKLNTVFVRD